MPLSTTPFLRFLIAGRLTREYVLLPKGPGTLDGPGGGALYAAAGVCVWTKEPLGLIARVGSEYPQAWLDRMTAHGYDTRGVLRLPHPVEERYFVAYPDLETRQTTDPLAHFARLGVTVPPGLLGYESSAASADSRTQPQALTIRSSDFPGDYLDASAAHLCPMDWMTHLLLPAALRQGHVQTVMVDASPSYMLPMFWDDLPNMVKGLTAFFVGEDDICNLFQGRSNDLWEMAEALAAYGCEIVVIKRGAQGQYVYQAAGKRRWVVPAYPARVMDLTGAGDAFCGGFLAGYQQYYQPLEAALCGNISASLVIEGSGPYYALDAMPGLAQARLEALRGMVRKV